MIDIQSCEWADPVWRRASQPLESPALTWPARAETDPAHPGDLSPTGDVTADSLTGDVTAASLKVTSP